MMALEEKFEITLDEEGECAAAGWDWVLLGSQLLILGLRQTVSSRANHMHQQEVRPALPRYCIHLWTGG